MGVSTLNDSNSFLIGPSPPEIFISRSIRLGLYVFIWPCSLLCTLFVLYHLLKKKLHRWALHNHALIFLLLSGLLFELIDLPLQMDYLNLGYIRFQLPSICLIWMLIEFWCHAANSLLLTWASFERHILVFHSRWMSDYFPTLFNDIWLSFTIMWFSAMYFY